MSDWKQNIIKNLAYAKVPSGGYQTPLAPDEEAQFQQWVLQNNIPFDPESTADYDMRGFYAALAKKDPKAVTAINNNDNQIHFPDFWKTPYHQSFSAESQFALPNAPSWNDRDQLVLPSGEVVFDERARK